MAEGARTVVVFGAGGHGLVVADAAACAGLELLGFLDERRAPGDQLVAGVVLGSAEWCSGHPSVAIVPGIGDNAARRRIVQGLEGEARAVVSVVHPSAVISRWATLGSGTVVLALSVVNARARVGAGAIINTGAVVEHDVSVGDFAHVSPNATLAGGASLGELSQLGAGACVLPGVKVGRGCVVGAGAVVTRDIPDGSVCAGVPARVRRQVLD